MLRGVTFLRSFQVCKHIRWDMCAARDSAVGAAGDELCGSSSGEAQPKRPQFGNRFLTEEQNVFQHNAWDNVQWDEAQEAEAEKQVTCNSVLRVSDEKCKLYEDEAPQYWDKFYGQHQNRFFKDRHWLFTEFPELHLNTKQVPPDQHSDRASICVQDVNRDFPGSHASIRFLEVGCGVGNTVFPILETNNDPSLFMYCCDFAPVAIQLVKEHPDYNPARCHAFVFDITDENAVFPFPERSLDAILMVFVLSAVKPDKMPSAIRNLARLLKPGGALLFRDYGRYDLAQLRFKKGQCLSENFYVRGDGTRVYFFTQDELRSLFTAAGLVESFNIIDRRLQVNRSRQLKMYRVWIQCKYVKSEHAA